MRVDTSHVKVVHRRRVIGYDIARRLRYSPVSRVSARGGGVAFWSFVVLVSLTVWLGLSVLTVALLRAARV